MLSIINLAPYRFIQLPGEILSKLHFSRKAKANELRLKGTILLSVEGINISISGENDAIGYFQNFLSTHSYFQNLEFKKTFSNFQPFKKLLAKQKKKSFLLVLPTLILENMLRPISPLKRLRVG